MVKWQCKHCNKPEVTRFKGEDGWNYVILACKHLLVLDGELPKIDLEVTV